MSLVSKAQTRPRAGESTETVPKSHEFESVRPARLRVGLLLPVWYLGGVERYHLALAKWTSPVIEWVGCALTSASLVRQPSIDALAAVMPVHADLHSGAEHALWNVIRHESEQAAIDAVADRCDVLLTWGVQSLESRLRGFRGRVVVISHGDGQWTRGWLREAETRATDCVAVSTEAAAAFSRPDVTILPGGVELDRLAPTQSRQETRDVWGVGNRQAVGFVGRFSNEKNPLQAARIVGELGDGYLAVYHGHNPFGDEKFRQEATALSGGRIVFLGPEWHTGDVYSGLDCLIQASPAEGGPLVTMEAWICCVPVVTTNVGIVRDDQDLAECSRVVLSGDLRQWCWEVQAAVLERGSGCWSTDEARALARERYSAASMARRWELFLDRSVSGPGSTLGATVQLREALPGLLQELGVKSLLDAPCGDCHWFSRVPWSGQYLGVDCNRDLIARNRQQFPDRRFECLDLTSDPIPSADAVLCRDLLGHMSLSQIGKSLQQILKGDARWLLATTFPGRANGDIPEGDWTEVWQPLNLAADPFGLGDPVQVINEGCRWGNGAFADKSLGVWDLDAVRKEQDT